MDAPYREAPPPRPVVALREVTAPLGVGRGAAAALLLAGLVGASVVQATELACIRIDGGTWCTFITHRGFSADERVVDGPGVPLPRRGLYYDPLDVWRDDDRLADTARAFFRGDAGTCFAVLRRAGVGGAFALAVSLLAPLAGVAALLLAERRTRVITLTIDPAGRVARANRALAAGAPADPSPPAWLRLAPSALLAAASLALVARVAPRLEALPPTTGTVALTSSATRCAVDGMTLLRGGRVEWSAPVGLTRRTLVVTMPDGAGRTAWDRAGRTRARGDGVRQPPGGAAQRHL
jgi:hypothetical protein